MLGMFSKQKKSDIKWIEANLVDERIKPIWDLVKRKYKISIAEYNADNYAVFTQGKNVKFFINKNNISKESFAHEVLHVWINYNEMHCGQNIIRAIDYSNINLFTDKLKHHISNCIDHVLMYDLFVSLGFERTKFTEDYNEYFLLDYELESIVNHKKLNLKDDISIFDYYVGKLVSIICDPNKDHDYTNVLPHFERIEPELYKIITEYISNIKELRIDKNESIKYIPMNIDLIDKLENWQNN